MPREPSGFVTVTFTAPAVCDAGGVTRMLVGGLGDRFVPGVACGDPGAAPKYTRDCDVMPPAVVNVTGDGAFSVPCAGATAMLKGRFTPTAQGELASVKFVARVPGEKIMLLSSMSEG